MATPKTVDAPSLANGRLRGGVVRRSAAAVDSQESAKRAEFATKLRGYADLPDDWDGYNGHAPAQKDIENAVRFIPHIPARALPSAQLMVAGDGDVGFRWRLKDRFLEIGFSEGDISFYGEAPNGKTGKGEAVFTGEIPENLRNLIQSVFAN